MAIVAAAFGFNEYSLISIRQIADYETWPVRGQVFQPGRGLKKNKLKGDAEAMHLGAFINDELIGVLTWGHKGAVAKVRKLAVLAPWRRQGVAGQLMCRCLVDMLEQDAQRCSLLATQGSVGFYQSIGFEVVNPDVRRGHKRYVQLSLSLA